MAGQSVSESPAITCKRQLLLLLLLCVFLSLMECMHALKSAQPKNGLRVDLVHIDSLLSENTTSTERMKRAIQRSQERLEKLRITSAVNTHQMKDIETPVSAGDSSGEYLIQMAIGTPAFNFSAIMDTGSDLVWTECNPCTDCSTSSIYDPSSSSTYSKVLCQSSLCQSSNFSCNNDEDCEYVYGYGDNSSTSGILSYETFSFSSQSLPNITFGCSHSNPGNDFGIVGFGRGNLSLVSQLGPSMGNKFSYCLVSRTDSSKTSPLFIGNTASLKATTVGSTPFLQNTFNPSFYYLSLEGISVGGRSLAIPNGTFDIQSGDGSGGLIIDSGTTYTYLQQAAYDVVKEAMNSSINLPQTDGSSVGLDLDLCFNQQGSSNASFPSMTFHFKGADYDVPKENYVFPNSSRDTVCLAMLPTNSSSDLGNRAIFGNVQQQNYQILYDNEKNVLSFAPTACDTL